MTRKSTRKDFGQAAILGTEKESTSTAMVLDTVKVMAKVEKEHLARPDVTSKAGLVMASVMKTAMWKSVSSIEAIAKGTSTRPSSVSYIKLF